MTTSVPIALLLVLIALSACGGADAGPPEINYGRDSCDSCDMVIDDPRFASAYRLPDGTERRFDDMGEMFELGTREDELGNAAAWVHDHDTEEWVEAEAAWYVKGADVETPMATGVVAFTEESRAQEYASERGGEVLAWDEMLREVTGTGSAPVHTGSTGGDATSSTDMGHAD